MTGILEQTRNEGYQAGYSDGRAIVSEMNQMERDEVFYSGQCSGRDEAPSRILWFLTGATVASLTWIWVLT